MNYADVESDTDLQRSNQMVEKLLSKSTSMFKQMEVTLEVQVHKPTPLCVIGLRGEVQYTRKTDSSPSEGKYLHG